jgi:hypothetical protein
LVIGSSLQPRRECVGETIDLSDLAATSLLHRQNFSKDSILV